MLPKTSALKGYDRQSKGMLFFLLKMVIYYKNIVLFGIVRADIKKEFD